MSVLRSLNPATGELVGQVEITPVEAIPGVVARARAAQPRWASIPLPERCALLARAGERLATRSEEIGELLTREMGKPLPEAIGEVASAAAAFRSDLAGIEEALAPEILENDRTRTTVHRDPFGVAACISPWNFPVLMPHEQVVPALAAGNSVVLKPSEFTPLCGQAYADVLLAELAAAGAPADVLQVVHGDEAQGKALVAADVDLVVFTGSRSAGKHILAAASRELKRVILELGGKDPLVVLEGADLDKAAAFAARNSFRNAGQVCVSTERIYVEDPIHDAFVDRLAFHAAKMRVGNGLDEGVAIGPMIHSGQRDHVLAQVASALDEGARVVWGGAEAKGNFLNPMILTGCTQDMAISREETFGPVACVYRVADADEAVALANDTPYGLGAVVYGPPELASRVARRLSAGMIGVNQGLGAAGPTPWVGARQSGYGFHSGRDGHRQFAQVRVINEARPR